jgi:nitrite reductase/ring-hydroxylating ferredoxin subunit/uncharacterized membrane protein
MQSRASIKSHPIHPMLIPFPFAFLTGGWGFGVASALSGKEDLKTVAHYLVPAGIAAGLIAAVPGMIDYTMSVPPRSSAKERATKHALTNVAALSLFAAGWWLSRRSRQRTIPMLFQTLGAAALSAGGWMGGTLAFRNQIGVDHRYANAGKWREETVETPDAMALDRIADGLELNQMELVHAGRSRVVVARTEDGVAAFADRCTHRGGPLSDGTLICGIVQCPWHGSQFDVRTGEVKCGPAKEAIETFPSTSRAARRRP